MHKEGHVLLNIPIFLYYIYYCIFIDLILSSSFINGTNYSYIWSPNKQFLKGSLRNTLHSCPENRHYCLKASYSLRGQLNLTGCSNAAPKRFTGGHKCYVYYIDISTEMKRWFREGLGRVSRSVTFSLKCLFLQICSFLNSQVFYQNSSSN